MITSRNEGGRGTAQANEASDTNDQLTWSTISPEEVSSRVWGL